MGAIAKKNFLCSISGVAALPERETAGEGRSAIAVFGLTTVFERTHNCPCNSPPRNW